MFDSGRLLSVKYGLACVQTPSSSQKKIGERHGRGVSVHRLIWSDSFTVLKIPRIVASPTSRSTSVLSWVEQAVIKGPARRSDLQIGGKKARQRRARAFLFNLFLCAIFHTLCCTFRLIMPFRKVLPSFTLTVVYSVVQFTFHVQDPQWSFVDTGTKRAFSDSPTKCWKRFSSITSPR